MRILKDKTDGEVYINKADLIAFIKNHGEVVSVGVSDMSREPYLLAYEQVIDIINRAGEGKL